MNYTKLFLYALITFMIGMSCSPKSKHVVSPEGQGERNVLISNDKEKTLSLKDYLIRMPNLYWANNEIMLRETSSIVSQHGPLYVVDGVEIGHEYSNAESMVDPNDIKSIKVLTNASETSIYGLDGNRGVILIKTK